MATKDEIECITITVDMNFNKLWKIVKDREVWCAAAHGVQRVEHDSVIEEHQQAVILLDGLTFLSLLKMGHIFLFL